MKELEAKITNILFDAMYEKSGTLLGWQLDKVVGKMLIPLITETLIKELEGLRLEHTDIKHWPENYDKAVVRGFNEAKRKLDTLIDTRIKELKGE